MTGSVPTPSPARRFAVTSLLPSGLAALLPLAARAVSGQYWVGALCWAGEPEGKLGTWPEACRSPSVTPEGAVGTASESPAAHWLAGGSGLERGSDVCPVRVPVLPLLSGGSSFAVSGKLRSL